MALLAQNSTSTYAMLFVFFAIAFAVWTMAIAKTAKPMAAPRSSTQQPKWIVNDLGELGVKVGERLFFLYKGDSIEYGRDGISAIHEDGSPMLYRIVGKREFGETQWPYSWIKAGRRQDRYTEKLVFHPVLSDGKAEDGDWRPIPGSFFEFQPDEGTNP